MYRTLYEAIGVTSNATQEEIEAACLKLGAQYREQWTEKGSAEKFFEVEKAYETLTAPDKRRAYDELILRDSKNPFDDPLGFGQIFAEVIPPKPKPSPTSSAPIKKDGVQNSIPSIHSEIPLVRGKNNVAELGLFGKIAVVFGLIAIVVAINAMSFLWAVALFAIVGLAIGVLVAIVSSPEDRKYGSENSFMTCQHCNASGTVRTKSVIQKKGISGGKATAAILTGGTSLLATGLSRKEQNTQAHCMQCGNTWYF